MSGTKELRYAKGIMRKIGMRLIHEKREALSIHGNNWQEDRRQRDLLTLLIQGNADPSIPEHERLSDEDILAREFATYRPRVRYRYVLLIGPLEIPT